jgi:hypothetical protein
VDPSVASRVSEAGAPRHADIELDPDDAVVTSPPPAHSYSEPYQGAESGHADTGQETRRLSYDDRDRYDPGTGYGTTPYGEPDPYTRPRNGYDARESAFPTADTGAPDNPYLSPFAATPPPPVPPQTTRRIRPEQHRAPEEPSAAERQRAAHSAEGQPAGPAEAEQRGMPRPLPEPIPLKVDSEETDKAAKRLAALLRDNPSLLRPSSPD